MRPLDRGCPPSCDPVGAHSRVCIAARAESKPRCSLSRQSQTGGQALPASPPSPPSLLSILQLQALLLVRNPPDLLSPGGWLLEGRLALHFSLCRKVAAPPPLY